MKPFCIEVHEKVSPDIAFGRAQNIYRSNFQHDNTTGSILTKNSIQKIDAPSSKVRESLIEYVLRLIDRKDVRIYEESSPAAYITDGHGYFLFFGFAKDKEKD